VLFFSQIRKFLTSRLRQHWAATRQMRLEGGFQVLSLFFWPSNKNRMKLKPSTTGSTKQTRRWVLFILGWGGVSNPALARISVLDGCACCVISAKPRLMALLSVFTTCRSVTRVYFGVLPICHWRLARQARQGPRLLSHVLHGVSTPPDQSTAADPPDTQHCALEGLRG
jgi:hypothetical protein